MQNLSEERYWGSSNILWHLLNLPKHEEVMFWLYIFYFKGKYSSTTFKLLLQSLPKIYILQTVTRGIILLTYWGGTGNREESSKACLTSTTLDTYRIIRQWLTKYLKKKVTQCFFFPCYCASLRWNIPREDANKKLNYVLIFKLKTKCPTKKTSLTLQAYL